MLPRKLNWCTVYIRRLDKTATAMDTRFREPAGEPVYLPAEPAPAEALRAQLKYFSFEEKQQRRLGNLPKTDGRLWYRTPSDLTKLLKAGDLIVAVPAGNGLTRPVRFAIQCNRPVVHIQGWPRMQEAEFVMDANVFND